LQFAISDSGIGISPEDQQRIFAPFTQADASTTRKYGGTGLGLTISRRLVNLMGGQIGVESRLGLGSTFHFTARFGLSPEPCPEEDLPPAARDQLHGVPVLVVDDNPTARHTLEQILAHWSMKPDAAPDVPIALAKLHQASASGRPFKVVIANSLLPGIDGFTLAAWIRDRPGLAGSTILMLSPIDRPGVVKECQELGAGYVEKPISQSDLLGAISAALGRPTRPAQARVANTFDAITPAARPLRVLLAEDTPANRKLIAMLLQKRGHNVEMAADGRLALDLLHQQHFDAVLMDVQMPRMDGFQATAAIRKLADPTKARVPIIAMTAYALKGDQERCLAAGMDAYVSKPIRAEEIIETLERLAGDGLTG
jgi:CheY-like chemotaxis protein